MPLVPASVEHVDGTCHCEIKVGIARTRERRAPACVLRLSELGRVCAVHRACGVSVRLGRRRQGRLGDVAVTQAMCRGCAVVGEAAPRWKRRGVVRIWQRCSDDRGHKASREGLGGATSGTCQVMPKIRKLARHWYYHACRLGAERNTSVSMQVSAAGLTRVPFWADRHRGADDVLRHVARLCPANGRPSMTNPDAQECSEVRSGGRWEGATCVFFVSGSPH